MERFVITILAAIAILVPGFYGNVYNTASPHAFSHFQEDSSALVYAGLAHADRIGPGEGAFGLWLAIKNRSPAWIDASQKAWLENGLVTEWRAYASQIGLHGHAYALLHKLLPMEHGAFIQFLELLNSVLLAAVIGVVVWWLCCLTGNFGPAVVLLLLPFSPWLTLMARNLYWVQWTWFLPTLAAIYATSRRLPRYAEVILLAGAVFLRAACGYEYISFVLICMMLPYLTEQAENWKTEVNRLFRPAVAGLSGFAAAVTVHAVMRADRQGIGYGLAAIWADMARRTAEIGDTAGLPAAMIESLRAPLSDVLSSYMQSVLVQLPGGFALTSQVVLLWVVAAWLIYLVSGREGKVRNLGLVATASALAPLSWYVLAKAHSYVHVHINHVLWTVPFLLTSVAFIVAAVLSALAKMAACKSINAPTH